MKRTITSLDGLRGAAALLVALFHLNMGTLDLTYLQGGYLAVDLFFVLSGFVISSAYSEQLDDGPRLFAFLTRRFGRLWPTHIVTTIIYYGLANVLLGLGTAITAGHFRFKMLPTTREIASTLTMTQGLHLFASPFGTAVSWSACDEFFVYILFALLCFHFRGARRIALLSSMMVISFALVIWASLAVHECTLGSRCMDITSDFGWARCIAGFFAGALLSEFRESRAALMMRTVPTQCTAVLLSCFIVAFSYQIPGLAFIGPASFVLLVGSLSGDTGPVARVLNTMPFQYSGRISYSLYLTFGALRPITDIVRTIDSPIAQGIGATVFILLSFAVADILYRRIEAPWRIRFHALADRICGNRLQQPAAS
ncbi:acyltransferase family protein [Burkholderia territorii]|uniref:Acyltransferase n=1 Tax=Burkholderia territorii TaxID=1503055 RepID=A0A6L3NLH1_9BURK|nr:acyltransferase [Burkholderia territorii]KAB0684431.1 acyltransferase [Burkholderia territorii]MBM2772160.1 acyltransferase [Burkholderia territorii]VWB14573.1 O-antigen acetylase [Burkholderia territorii]